MPTYYATAYVASYKHYRSMFARLGELNTDAPPGVTYEYRVNQDAPSRPHQIYRVNRIEEEEVPFTTRIRVVSSHATMASAVVSMSRRIAENDNSSVWFDIRSNHNNPSRPYQVRALSHERYAMPTDHTPPELDIIDVTSADGANAVTSASNSRSYEWLFEVDTATTRAATDWIATNRPARMVVPPPPPETFTCSDCGFDRLVEDGRYTGFVYSWRNNRSVDLCWSCYQDMHVCNDCDVWVQSDDVYSIDENSMCPRCADDNYWRCDDCDEYNPNSRTYCDYCQDSEPASNSGCTCASCTGMPTLQRQPEPVRFGPTRAPIGSINSYSYRPSLRFRGMSERDGARAHVPHFGMEIEVTTPYHGREYLDYSMRQRVRGEAAYKVQEAFGDLVYLKEDSSISCGFEIVTHPMTYSWAHETLPWDKWGVLAGDGVIGADDSTGIHVHVSRAGFAGAAHTYRWLTWFYRNAEQVRRIARREDGSYSHFSDGHKGAHLMTVKPGRRRCGRCYDCVNYPSEYYCQARSNLERYSAINLINSNTFEVRVFASSVKPREIRSALGLVSASVEYTRKLSSNDVARQGWAWTPFTDFVASRDEYTPLAEEISALCAC